MVKKLLFGWLLFSSFSSSGQEIAVVRRGFLSSEAVADFFPAGDTLAIAKAMDAATQFLLGKREGYAMRDSAAARKYLTSVASGDDPQQVKYEIFSVVLPKQGLVSMNILSYMHYPRANFQMLQGMFRIDYNAKENRLIYPVENTDFVKTDFSKIRFVSKREAVNRGLYLKSNRFVEKLNANISAQYPGFQSPKERLTYVVGSPFDALSYVHHREYLFTSRYNRAANTILDVQTGGFYAHELVHYVFSGYKFGYFLNEALATYLSGGQASFLGTSSQTWKELDTVYSGQEERIGDSLLLHGHNAKAMYHAGAVLLCKFREKVGTKAFYKTVFDILAPMDDVSALAFLKKELLIDNLLEYLQKARSQLQPCLSKVFRPLHR